MVVHDLGNLSALTGAPTGVPAESEREGGAPPEELAIALQRSGRDWLTDEDRARLPA